VTEKTKTAPAFLNIPVPLTAAQRKLEASRVKLSQGTIIIKSWVPGFAVSEIILFIITKLMDKIKLYGRYKIYLDISTLNSVITDFS